MNLCREAFCALCHIQTVCIWECLFKIPYKRVILSTFVQDFSPIIYYRLQLSFTTVFFFYYFCSECMLPIWQETVFFQSDPWCLNLLCPQVTCKECMLMKQGDNCLLKPCHPSKTRDKCLPNNISLEFHQCPMNAETDVQRLDRVLQQVLSRF